jgi:hypothetical protein
VEGLLGALEEVFDGELVRVVIYGVVGVLLKRKPFLLPRVTLYKLLFEINSIDIQQIKIPKTLRLPQFTL